MIYTSYSVLDKFFMGRRLNNLYLQTSTRPTVPCGTDNWLIKHLRTTCCIYTENSYSTLLDRRREGQMFQCQCLDNSQRFQGGAHLHYTVKSLPNNCSTDVLASLLSLLVLTSRPCSDSMYINIEFPVV